LFFVFFFLLLSTFYKQVFAALISSTILYNTLFIAK